MTFIINSSSSARELIIREKFIICTTGLQGMHVHQLSYLNYSPFPGKEFSWLQPYHCEGQVQ